MVRVTTSPITGAGLSTTAVTMGLAMTYSFGEARAAGCASCRSPRMLSAGRSQQHERSGGRRWLDRRNELPRNPSDDQRQNDRYDGGEHLCERRRLRRGEHPMRDEEPEQRADDSKHTGRGQNWLLLHALSFTVIVSLATAAVAPASAAASIAAMLTAPPPDS